MVRIGGDRICESALTAASSIEASPEKLPREVEMQSGFGKAGISDPASSVQQISVQGSAAMHSRYATAQAPFARLCFRKAS
jgi:hypothetical protein